VLGLPGSGGLLTLVDRRSRFRVWNVSTTRRRAMCISKSDKRSQNFPTRSGGRSRSTTAVSSLAATLWRSLMASVYTLPSRVVRTNVVRTKTPTVSFGNSSPKESTSER